MMDNARVKELRELAAKVGALFYDHNDDQFVWYGDGDPAAQLFHNLGIDISQRKSAPLSPPPATPCRSCWTR
jgi:hypothetical protein